MNTLVRQRSCMHVSGETVALSPPDRYNTVIQPWVSGSSPYWIARSLW